MTEENQRFLDMLTGKITFPKEDIGYKNPYQGLTDKQLYKQLNELRPDLEYEDTERCMKIIEEMGIRYLNQLTKRYE